MEYTNNKYFVIDFDSTFTKVEALDVLGEIALEGKADKTGKNKQSKGQTIIIPQYCVTVSQNGPTKSLHRAPNDG